MKKLILTIAAIAMALIMTACNEQVPAGTVGKILGKNGFQPEVFPPSKVWLSNNMWNLNHEKLFLVETTTQKFAQPIKVLLKDKLTLNAEIVFRCRITTNPKVINALFNDMPMNDNIVTTTEVYNTYAKMLVMNTAREVISKYNVDEININYGRITTELYNAISPKLVGLPMDISDVTIGNIAYPAIVTMAIEQAKEKQMAIEKEEAQVQIELTKARGAEEIAKATYRIKMLEAKRIRDFDLMIAEGITSNTLRLRELELKEKELDKWDGILPTTLMGGNVPIIVNTK